MPDPAYHNFDLFFQPDGDGYRVRADSSEGQATTTFSLPFSDIELENFILTTRPGRRGVRRIDAPDVAAAKRFGGNLFQAIFNGDVQGCWRSSLSATAQQDLRMRVRLRFTDTPELADLPWEYLFSTSLNRFLALDDDLALVRYLDMPERTRPVAVTLPLRVLVMISNPGDYPRLDVEQEWAQIQEALGPLQARGLVEIDLLAEATLPALRKKLQSAQYHILHFIGHGAFDRQTQEGVVVLKDEGGRGRLVSGQQLGWLLHNYRTLALVILNACEGARADRTDPFSGTAQSLVQQGIPAVVAMQFEITDGAAKTFSQAFYAAIAEGHPVENALFEARMAIFTEDHGLEWATPVLYTRAAEGHLFDISAVPSTVPLAAAPIVTAEPQQVSPPAEVAEPVAKMEPVAPIEHTPVQEPPAVAAVVEEHMRQVEPVPVPIPEPSAGDIRKARIEALYTEAREAAARGDWTAAIESARQVLALDDLHEGAAAILRDGLQENELARLYSEASSYIKAGRWNDAIPALSQIKAKRSDYRDVSALLASATEQADAIRRQAAVPDKVRAAVDDAPKEPTVVKQPTAQSGRRLGVIGVVGGLALVALLLVLVLPGMLNGNNSQATNTPTPPGIAAFAPTAGTEEANSADGTATTSDSSAAGASDTAEPGGTSDATTAQGSFRMGLPAKPDNIDPQEASSDAEIDISRLVFEGLLGLNEKLELVPAAADSWEVSSDGLQYTLKLRDGLTYSDGTPLTASNFEYAWKRAFDPRLDRKLYSQLAYDIAGASELAAASPDDTAKIQELMDNLGVKATDDRTIVFTLAHPAAYFPGVLTLWIGFPVRQDLVESGGADWAKSPSGDYMVGNGPFILKQYDDQGIKLIANPSYWAGRTKLDEIKFAFIADPSAALGAYKAGELDALIVADSSYSAVANDSELQSDVTGSPRGCTTYFGINTTIAPFDDLRVRQAIAMALDRDDWDKNVLHGLGQGTPSLIPIDQRGYSSDLSVSYFDASGAATLLASAGYPNGKGFPTLTLTYPSFRQAGMEWLQDRLKKNLNIDVQLQSIEFSTYISQLSDQAKVPAIFLSNFCSDYPDPHDWLSVGFGRASNYAHTGWRNDDYDRLLSDADAQQDDSTRLDLYRQAHELLLRQASIIPMNFGLTVSLIKPNVNGIKQSLNSQDRIFPGITDILNVEIAH